MAKTIKSKLKKDEILVGELENLNDRTVVLKQKNGAMVQLAISAELHEAIEDDVSYGDIVEIKLDGDDYVLSVLDEWPNETPKT